jgi:hypothetical protein
MKTTDLPANDKILQPRPRQSIIHARAASSAAQKPRWQKKSSVFHRNNTIHIFCEMRMLLFDSICAP